LEIGRGGRLALLAVGLLPGFSEASCPITPQERNLDFRIVHERRAVELRRYGTPNSEPPLCVVRLAYGDDQTESCRVAEILGPP
jgi:hypothetical protein